MALVYLVTNRTNGKQYVGYTDQTLAVRRDQHERSALRESDGSRAFHGALRKHGLDVFVWSVVCEGSDTDMLVREAFEIAERGTRVPLGYNLTSGGERPEWHEDSRKLMSEAALNSPKAQAHRARLMADPVWVANRQASAAGSRRRLTDEQEDEVFVRYQTGTFRKDLARELNVSERCVSGAIKRAAVRAEDTPRDATFRSAEWRSRIGAKHKGKKISVEQIKSMRAGKDSAAEAERLQKFNEPRRKPVCDETIVRMRAEGCSQRAIGEKFGVSHAVVQKHLKRLGQTS